MSRAPRLDRQCFSGVVLSRLRSILPSLLSSTPRSLLPSTLSPVLPPVLLAALLGGSLADRATAEWANYEAALKGIVRNVFFQETVFAVEVQAGHAYVGDSDLKVLNVADPLNPLLLTTVSLNGSAKAITISGFFAYVATGNGGLTIVRIVNPGSAHVTDVVDTPGTAVDVAARAGYAYVADSNALKVIDATDPWNAAIVGSFPASGAAAVEVAGSYVFLADGTGLATIDVSVPANPLEVSRISVPVIEDMALDGAYLYVVFDVNEVSWLRRYDVSDPTHPVDAGQCRLRREWATCIAVDFPYAYAGTSGHWTNMSLEVVDVSDPAVPPVVVAGTAGGFWEITDVAVENGLAYVADDIWGINIVDVSIPHSVPIVRGFPTGDSAQDVAQVGDYLMVADRLDGLTVWDLEGHLMAQVPGLGETYGLETSGNFAYMTGSQGFHVIDISDPLLPVLRATIGLPQSPARDLAVDGNHAYIADRNAGMVIVDVSDPSAPQIVATYVDAILQLRGIDVAWPYAYITDDWHGFEIVDVSDPGNPAGRGVLSPGFEEQGYGSGVAVSGDYAYIVSGYAGMWVADISDPDAPALVSHHPNHLTMSAVVDGSILYTARVDLGIQLWDISEPAAPRLIGESDTSDQVFNLFVGPTNIAVANYNDGIVLLPRHDAVAGVPVADGVDAGGADLSVWPNPARDRLRVEFPRFHADPVLEIVDLSGRLIRRLGGGIGDTGIGDRWAFDWDCRDEGGRPVASGTYFVRGGGSDVRGGNGSTRRVIVMR